MEDKSKRAKVGKLGFVEAVKYIVFDRGRGKYHGMGEPYGMGIFDDKDNPRFKYAIRDLVSSEAKEYHVLAENLFKNTCNIENRIIALNSKTNNLEKVNWFVAIVRDYCDETNVDANIACMTLLDLARGLGQKITIKFSDQVKKSFVNKRSSDLKDEKIANALVEAKEMLGRTNPKAYSSQIKSKLTLAAREGMEEAQLELGRLYYEGTVFEKDDQKAFSYFSKVAERNNPEALYMLGLCYENGRGIELNQRKAYEKYAFAAKLGYGEACYRMYVLISSGKVNDDKKEENPIVYLKTAAEKGVKDSYYDLACAYEEGKEIEKDEVKAFEYFSKADELGIPNAKMKVARAYLGGIGVDKDEEKGISVLEEAVSKSDLGVAKIAIVREFLSGEGRNERIAYRLCKQIVEKDSTPEILEIIGKLLVLGVDRGCEKEAVHYFKKSAESGNVRAFYELALCYYEGFGVGRDSSAAYYYFLLSAIKGCTEAMNQVAICYIKGSGVDKDYAQAIKWLEKGKKGNDEKASRNLSILLSALGKNDADTHSRDSNFYACSVKTQKGISKMNQEPLINLDGIACYTLADMVL